MLCSKFSKEFLIWQAMETLESFISEWPIDRNVYLHKCVILILESFILQHILFFGWIWELDTTSEQSLTTLAANPSILLHGVKRSKFPSLVNLTILINLQ